MNQFSEGPSGFDPNEYPPTDGDRRRDQSFERRRAAARTAFERDAARTRNNGEKRWRQPVTAFHKGLQHDAFGLPDPEAFRRFRLALADDPDGADGHRKFDVPIGPKDGLDSWPAGRSGSPVGFGDAAVQKVRRWESPLGGLQYDLEGPDSAAVAIAPAPALGTPELTVEMAEVYGLAALRDVPFTAWDDDASPYTTVASEIAAMPGYADHAGDPSTPDDWRRRGRHPVGDTSKVFRGSTPGAQHGPYISQFLLIGSADRRQGGSAVDGAREGMIRFGAQRIDQRVNPHPAGRDYMCDWASWLDVQNGADVGGRAEFGALKFIETPRDLATYVHYDELYQAYFNAALLMSAYGLPLDYGLPSGMWHGTRASFATFGGPHLLALLSEVASRGLKAVRRQKFQHHLRGRPEQLAAMLTLAANGHGDRLGHAGPKLERMHAALTESVPETMARIAGINAAQADGLPGPDGSAALSPNHLLPMAFPEGSPMHASYGAGHATVAGACVTILKAFFELSTAPGSVSRGLSRPVDRDKLVDADEGRDWWSPVSILHGGMGLDQLYVAGKDGACLEPAARQEDLTVEGELDKLAANISIGRNMAGVHFYADYYDSLRLGERIAAGILEEQMWTYIEPATMRFTSFDGDRVIVWREPDGYTKKAGVGISVAKPGGGFTDYRDEWWSRHFGKGGGDGDPSPLLASEGAGSGGSST